MGKDRRYEMGEKKESPEDYIQVNGVWQEIRGCFESISYSNTSMTLKAQLRTCSFICSENAPL